MLLLPALLICLMISFLVQQLCRRVNSCLQYSAITDQHCEVNLDKLVSLVGLFFVPKNVRLLLNKGPDVCFLLKSTEISHITNSACNLKLSVSVFWLNSWFMNIGVAETKKILL